MSSLGVSHCRKRSGTEGLLLLELILISIWLFWYFVDLIKQETRKQ